MIDHGATDPLGNLGRKRQHLFQLPPDVWIGFRMVLQGGLVE